MTTSSAQGDLSRQTDGVPAVSRSTSPDRLAASISERRERIAGNLDELVGRVKPAAVAARARNAAQARMRHEFLTPTGELRTDRAAAVGLGFVSLIGLFIGTKVSSKKRKSRLQRRLEKKLAALSR